MLLLALVVKCNAVVGELAKLVDKGCITLPLGEIRPNSTKTYIIPPNAFEVTIHAPDSD